MTFDPRTAPLGARSISDMRIIFNVPPKSVVVDNLHVNTWVIGWPDLSLYVADTGNHRIDRIDNWTASGWVAKFSAFGSQGSGVGQFNEPMDVEIDAQGRIYIADTHNHRIVRVNDMTGAGWTTLGTGTCGTAVVNSAIQSV